MSLGNLFLDMEDDNPTVTATNGKAISLLQSLASARVPGFCEREVRQGFC
jgi:hypothetical protein